MQMYAANRKVRILLVVVLLSGIPSLLSAAGPLRVVSYNVYHNPADPGDPYWQAVLSGMGAEEVNGVAKRPDILALTELDTSIPTAQHITTIMNNLYGGSGGSYTYVDIQAGSYERYGFVYDTSSVDLLETATIPMGYRPGLRGKFRPVGYTSEDASFYCYDVHLKAYPGFEEERAAEVSAMRFRDADHLPAETHIIYAGDFNFVTNPPDGEPGYGMMMAPGNGQAVDPEDGHWTSPYCTYSSSYPYSRIDFQFVSTEFVDGEGLDLIDGSYRAYGNDNGSTSGHPEVRYASDHLAVVADYQIPAKMSVTVGSAPGRMIVGANAGVDVTVENTADVVAVIGADELDYTISGSAVSGPGIDGIDPAMGGGNTHSVSLKSDTVGAFSGSVNVDSDSQGVENGQFSQQVDYDVLAHSEASFDSGGNQDNLTIGFGIVRQGRVAGEQSFSVCNLETTPGYTAALDLDEIVGNGDIDRLATDATVFADLVAGGCQEFAASLDTSQNGGFSATYTLAVSDEDLPGAATGNDLILTLNATVSLLGDVDLDGDQSPDDIDTNDIDACYTLFGTSGPFADLNDSCLVDQADVDMLIRDIIGTNYGDADLDGDIDTDDLLVVSTHWDPTGQTYAYWQGDFDGDDDIDTDDLLAVSANWDPVGGRSTVPEPATLFLLGAGGLVGLIGRSRRTNKHNSVSV